MVFLLAAMEPPSKRRKMESRKLKVENRVTGGACVPDRWASQTTTNGARPDSASAATEFGRDVRACCSKVGLYKAGNPARGSSSLKAVGGGSCGESKPERTGRSTLCTSVTETGAPSELEFEDAARGGSSTLRHSFR